MKISYKKLWKLLIDKEMKRKELSRRTGVGSSTLTKMWKGGYVNLEILVRICNALDCGLDEVVELVPDGENTDGA
ncbi:MAG: helix-turn-helix transcriptional regulator [Clostridiales Family XIII bacterium]|jgi:DNA-binding Xre family transcriptional regulator|nr:helix-turn-helix transcriptional regulator [Clostridiales Family XIII bacterium]